MYCKSLHAHCKKKMITILTVKNVKWLTEISLLYTVNNCDRSDGTVYE